MPTDVLDWTQKNQQCFWSGWVQRFDLSYIMLFNNPLQCNPLQIYAAGGRKDSFESIFKSISGLRVDDVVSKSIRFKREQSKKLQHLQKDVGHRSGPFGGWSIRNVWFAAPFHLIQRGTELDRHTTPMSVIAQKIYCLESFQMVPGLPLIHIDCWGISKSHLLLHLVAFLLSRNLPFKNPKHYS